ncbi:MAG: cell division protein ZapA [Candidatus Cloacimonetes bacterium]|nr:cell division protein ZapA [Candidatus Cloacimonadota bacterium]
MKSIQIEILGKKYDLKCDEPEKIIEYAEYLNSELDNLIDEYNIVEQNKLLVLLLLRMIEKDFKEADKTRNLQIDMDQLNSLIDDAEQKN